MTTNNTKHTPGPWRMQHRHPNSANGAKILGPGDAVIARMSYAADKPMPQKHADARLIAAAPELLEALKQLEVEFGLQETYGLRLARAAIAKATGESA